ncbi:MAG: hypothetical protein AB1861_19405 [Cyanobacteriota bacterium]
MLSKKPHQLSKENQKAIASGSTRATRYTFIDTSVAYLSDETLP